MNKRRLLLGLAGLAALLAVTLFAGWWQVDGPGAITPRLPKAAGPPPLAQAAMTLTDHEGRRISPANWVGRPILLFFGFTYCPDVCPTTLSDITGWLEVLGEDAQDMNVAFVTVDPERDTVETMSEYLDMFHPSIVGYTGTPDDIKKTADFFGVFYDKVKTEGGYTMNHTATVLLFDAAGNFQSTIDYHEAREIAVPKIKKVL